MKNKKGFFKSNLIKLNLCRKFDETNGKGAESKWKKKKKWTGIAVIETKKGQNKLLLKLYAR